MEVPKEILFEIFSYCPFLDIYHFCLNSSLVDLLKDPSLLEKKLDHVTERVERDHSIEPVLSFFTQGINEVDQMGKYKMNQLKWNKPRNREKHLIMVRLIAFYQSLHPRILDKILDWSVRRERTLLDVAILLHPTRYHKEYHYKSHEGIMIGKEDIHDLLLQLLLKRKRRPLEFKKSVWGWEWVPHIGDMVRHEHPKRTEYYKVSDIQGKWIILVSGDEHKFPIMKNLDDFRLYSTTVYFY